MEAKIIYCLYDDKVVNRRYFQNIIDNLDEEDICFYNSENDVFVNSNGFELDLSKKIVFPISGISYVDLIRKALKRKNINVFSSSLDDKKVNFWVKFYTTKRRMMIVEGKRILDPIVIEYIEKNLGIEKEFFFKTLFKNYSAFIKSNYLKNSNSVLFKSIKEHLEDLFVISEKVDISTDELGKLEFRCIIIDGKIKNISRFTDDLVHTVRSDVLKTGEEICERLSQTEFPRNYIMDLMIYKYNGEEVIDVVEFNDICSSGMYLYNSLIDLDTTNILHEDKYKLPKDKQHLKGNLSEKGKITSRASRYFDAECGFASSVKRFSIGLSRIFHHTKGEIPRYEDDLSLGDNSKDETFIDLPDLVFLSSEEDIKKLYKSK